MDTKTKLVAKVYNAYGISAANDLVEIGTKGHVHSFFLVINDLISSGKMEDNVKTISHDLYRTLIWEGNYERFLTEVPIFENALLNIPTSSIDWRKYPISNGQGEHNYQKRVYDTSLKNLGLVFGSFTKAMQTYIEWVNSYKKRNWGHPKMFVSPISLVTHSFLKRLEIDEFIASSANPLWLRRRVTPEISSDDYVILVHNHNLGNQENLSLSKAFTQARVEHMKSHLPKKLSNIDVIFDVRGQAIVGEAKTILSASNLKVRNVTFKEA